MIAPDTVLVEVDGCTVAWVPNRREFFALTPIASELVEALERDGADDLPTGLVADLAGQLRDIGVLVDRGDPPPSRPAADDEATPGLEEPFPGTRPDRTTTLGPYRALDHHFVVDLPDADDTAGLDVTSLASELGRVLAALEADRGPDAPSRYRVTSGQDGPRLWAGETLLDAHPSAAGVLATLLWDVNRRAVATVANDLVLHAGAVVDESGRTIVLPAAMEAGKTTLVAALVRAGMAYLSDELAALHDDHQVRAYPKALSLDPGTWPLFPELAPDATRRSLSPNQWLVTAEEVRPGARHTGPAAIDLLVFPQYEPDARTEIRALEPIQALHHLASCTFGFGERPREVLPDMVRLVAAVPAHRLTIGDGVDDAVAAVKGLVAEPNLQAQ